MKRDTMLNVRVPSDLKLGLARAAEADHGRSLSGMVVRILTEWLGERKYLEPQKPALRPKRTRKK